MNLELASPGTSLEFEMLSSFVFVLRHFICVLERAVVHLYAKRCMAILTHRSPRKSNLVIMMGKQWVVDWATGKLERCQPPDYGELDGKDATSEFRVGQSGNLIRV